MCGSKAKSSRSHKRARAARAPPGGQRTPLLGKTSPGSKNLISSPMASLSSFMRRLLIGFPVWHLAAHFPARHLARGVSDGLLVELLGLPPRPLLSGPPAALLGLPGLPLALLLFPAPGRLPPLAVGPVLGLQKGAEQIYGYGQHD